MISAFIVAALLFLGPAIVFAQIPFQAMAAGAGPLEIGALLTADVAATMLLAPVFGWLADRWTAKTVILVGFALSPLAFLLLAEARTFAAMLVARALMGASIAVRSVLQSFVVSLPSESRIGGLSGINGAYAVAYVGGSVISSLIFAWDPNAFECGAWAAAIISLVGLLFTWRFLGTSGGVTQRSSAVDRISLPDAQQFGRNQRLILLSQGVLAFGFSAFAATFGAWSASVLSWGAGHLAVAFLIAACASAALQFGIVSRISRRLGDVGTAIFACSATSIGLALLILVPNWGTAVLAAVVLAGGSGTALSSLQSLSSRHWRGVRQGSLFGASLSINSAARIIAPLIGGYAFSHWIEWAPFGLSLLAMMSTIAILKVASEIPAGTQLSTCGRAA